MGYYFYDVNGYVADGPSISGWKKLTEALVGPAARELVETGSTMDLLQLLIDLSQTPRPKDPATAESLKGLRDTASKATGVLILTDGVGHEE